MAVYFSKSPLGFWDSRIHASIPANAVRITDAHHRDLLAGQGRGKRIVADGQGNPILIDPPVTPPAVPLVVSRFQARMALRNAGLFEAAEAAVRDRGDVVLIEAWDSAGEFSRASPAINTLGAALGLGSTDIDHLFRAAAQITA